MLWGILWMTGCKQVTPEIEAAYALIERVTPGYGKQFVLELIPPEHGMDVYEIVPQDGRIVLRGNNPVALYPR